MLGREAESEKREKVVELRGTGQGAVPGFKKRRDWLKNG